MEGFFGIFIFIAISVIIAITKSSATKTTQPPTEAQRERDAEIRRQIAQRMREAQGYPSGERPVQQGQQPMQRSVMQKTDMSRPTDGTDGSYSPNTQRPIIAHDADECTGGSIHEDGYHEGVSLPPKGMFSEGRVAARKAPAPKRPIAAGGLGKAEAAAPVSNEAYDNARKTLERVQQLPPLTQGIVFAEILGKPRCEQY